ncbi:MAG: hypothetical protein PQJ50_14000 [Spirochaetales bacterium]|nr:hypothetical protein [Spirochaetales bacterium]
MTIDQTIHLVELLIYKTQNNEAIWNTTSSDDMFSLRLQSGSVSINSSDIYNSNNEVTDHEAGINVFNADGEEISSFSMIVTQAKQDIKFERLYTLLLELHNEVVDKVYKINDTFESILGELNSRNIVGKEKKKNDDIPF